MSKTFKNILSTISLIIAVPASLLALYGIALGGGGLFRYGIIPGILNMYFLGAIVGPLVIIFFVASVVTNKNAYFWLSLIPVPLAFLVLHLIS